MRILVIDDERTFNHHKLGDFVGVEHLYDSVLYARTLDQAAEQFWDTDTVWDVVFLDHDLGNNQDMRFLTRSLEREAYAGTLFPVRKFIIHSMNPLGRKEMYDALHKFYNVEFARVEDLL